MSLNDIIDRRRDAQIAAGRPLPSGRIGLVTVGIQATGIPPGTVVTLKIFPSSLRADAEKVARMGRELRIFASLDHPNVLRSFQIGQVGNVCYMALEDLKGETLATRLEREKRLPFVEACRIIRDVANGLAYLHKNDIVHRDLRPAHIWLTESGVPKIIEFGSARDAFADLDTEEGGGAVTMSSSVIGDYAKARPRQINLGAPQDAEVLADVAKIDQEAKLEGRSMAMIFAPDKGQKKKAEPKPKPPETK